MVIGVVGKDLSGWGTMQLGESLKKRGVSAHYFAFPQLAAKIGFKPHVSASDVDIQAELSALIVRSIGRGSLEEIIFRMDLLHRVEQQRILVVNPPKAIERCVDKYYALALLEEKGLPVPRTVVTENVNEALKAFNELGGDIVLKPLFGSRGVGLTRISDADVAERIFEILRFHHDVLYLQEFVDHGKSDIRVFVVGNNVAAAMRRVGDSWKTNISQGAQPTATKLSDELATLALNAAKAVDCKVAGVDILETSDGPLIIELNSQPGWRGLQSITQVNIADCIVDYVLSKVEN